MMKNSFKLLVLILMLSLVLAGCHIPVLKNAEPTAAPTAVPAEPVSSEPEEDDSMLLQRDSGTAEEDDSMLLQRDSGGTAPESEGGEGEGDDMMITRPSSAIPNEMKAAGLSMMPARAGGFSAAQIQNVVAPTPQPDIIIRNDQNITYDQNPPIIQRSVPSGQLQPLGYIPPQYLASGQSIAFGAGETSAVISGYVPAGGVVSYNLYAFTNQNLLVLLSSDSGTSVLSVSDVYGNVFLDPNQRQTRYSMYLPRTATYYVNIYSTGYAENFTLQVFIPARVTIPTGRTSVSYNGAIGPYGVVSYTAYMYAGQTARIDDYSGPQPTSFLRVSGLQTGVVYMDYTAYSPSWYAVVPATQDYLIEVISINQPSNYTLTVDVR